MEYLRNLPSKTNAFSNATYERVRSSNTQNRSYFATHDQTPNQILASSDENLILAAIRHKKQAATIQAEPPKRSSTPDRELATEQGNNTPQQPRLYKRPRIALSNQSATTAANAATVVERSSSSSSISSPFLT